jgi:uridylate kinase
LAKSEKLTKRQVLLKRVLLKVSGEAIQGQGSSFSLETVDRIVLEIRQIQEMGVEIGLVIGGGNILRGEKLAQKGMSRISSDSMGMLATVINGVLFENAFSLKGIPAIHYSAIPAGMVAQNMNPKGIERSLREKNVVIFSGGTGNPYFTTDSAAALRACEIGAQALLKATKVDGVYDRDPALSPDARFFPELRYEDVLKQGLRVMDMTAVSMCRENGIPIIVFNLLERGNLIKLISGEKVGTIIKE